MTLTNRSKHILVTALGSSGDLNPMLGICGALKRRGHDVTLITNPAFGKFATALGIELEPVTPPWLKQGRGALRVLEAQGTLGGRDAARLRADRGFVNSLSPALSSESGILLPLKEIPKYCKLES